MNLEKYPTRQARRLRERRLGRVRKTLSATVVAALAFGGIAVLAPAASAATTGTGIEFSGAGWQGSIVTSTGATAFCFTGGQFPDGGDTSIGMQSNVGGLNNNPGAGNVGGVSGNQLAGVNRIITENGGTGDPNTAVALGFAVKHFLERDLYSTASYPNNAAWPTGNIAKFVEWRLSVDGTSSNWQAIAAQAQAFVDIANSTVAGSGGAGGSGELVFDVNTQNNYDGTVVMNGTAGSTGSITLTNGFFDDNDNGVQDAGETNVKSGATAGTSYSIYGIAPEDGSDYKIGGEGDFTPAGTAGYLAQLEVFTNPKQLTVATGGMATPAPFHVSGGDPMPRESTFQPVLASDAATYVKAGENFTDSLNFATVADADGVNNDWYRAASGRYAPITATATIYGPYATAPAEAAEAPADAPVAGTASVTTDPATGPTVSYTATSDAKASESGFYVWVWTIDRAAQDARVLNYLPDPYSFKDRFALSEETSLVPATVSTKAQEQVYVGNSFTDTAIVKGSLPADGSQLHFELYAATKDDDGNWVCTEGNLVWTSDEQTVTKSGEYVSPEAPGQIAGDYNWIEVLEDQNGTELHRGECGIENETTKVIPPTVSTKSQAGSKLGDTLKDTAIVEGDLPADGAQLTFDAYQVPMVQGADGKWVVDTANAPKGATAEDLSWVCSEDNLVFSQEVAQDITKAGEYDSESFTTDAYGKVFWVETLSWDGKVIHRGECGLDNETSFVVDVTTKAQTSSSTSDTPTLNDTASLVGYVPEGGYTVFEAYRVAGDVNAESCTEDKLVFTSDKVALEGGLYTEEAPLEVTGGGFTAQSWNDASHVYWVEKTYDKLDREVSAGECGHGDETTAVAAAAVIVTGIDGASTPWALGGVFGLLLLAAGGTIFAIRRRRSVKAAEVSAE